MSNNKSQPWIDGTGAKLVLRWVGGRSVGWDDEVGESILCRCVLFISHFFDRMPCHAMGQLLSGVIGNFSAWVYKLSTTKHQVMSKKLSKKL